jgi:hypothetical protein
MGCCVCGNPRTQAHHVFYGMKNRNVSDEHGFLVHLCLTHHVGTQGVHGRDGHALDALLKRHVQAEYEQTHSREEFMALIGRSYL